MSIFFGAHDPAHRRRSRFNALPADFVEPREDCATAPCQPCCSSRSAVGAFPLACCSTTRSSGGRSWPPAPTSRAAALSGVPVERAIVVCHALSGALAALAGLMLSARNGAALPSMAGQLGIDWLLPAFLAPVLGGTLLTGGNDLRRRHLPGCRAGDGAVQRAAATERGRVLDPGVPGPRSCWLAVGLDRLRAMSWIERRRAR